MTETTPDTLQIYRVPSKLSYPQIVPAAAERDWMNVTTAGWANRCLPLRIANEAGWFLLNDCDFDVEWDGDPGMKSLHFNFPKPPAGMVPFNMVGYGIVSWVPPYLFRTPPGTNLWVRGPANMPKDGISALEGIVETDWLPYTFTINWKITRPGIKICFSQGEPICFLTAIQRHEAERLQPIVRNLVSDPGLYSEYREWHERRLRAKAISGEDGAHGKFAVSDQGHYIRGERSTDSRISEHQTKLHVKPIHEIEPALPLEDIARDTTDVPASAPQTDLLKTLQAYNGSVQLTDKDVIITRTVGWRDRLAGRKEHVAQLPLKKIKSVQVQETATFTQMAFIRFAVGDAPAELPYLAACRDPYTLLIDKPQVPDLQRFRAELKRSLSEGPVMRTAKASGV